jgi:hypothetical protein
VTLYWGRFFLPCFLKSYITRARYTKSFNILIASCTLPKDKQFWIESCLNEFCGEGNKVWRILLDYRHLKQKVDSNGFCPGSFLCRENGSPDETLSICLAHENREMYPKIILENYVKATCQVVFDNELSLHMWKRQPCTSTTERQPTDWCE